MTCAPNSKQPGVELNHQSPSADLGGHARWQPTFGAINLEDIKAPDCFYVERELPAYGYESANARHDQTYFPVDSEFYMTFLGPLVFIHPDGSPLAVVTWDEAQRAYA